MSKTDQSERASEGAAAPPDEQSRVAKREEAIKLYREGQQLVTRWDWATAYEKVQASINLYNRFPDVYIDLARCHIFYHRYEEALKAYDQALKLRPEHPPTHVSIGVTLQAMGKLNEAMSEYQKALRLDPSSIAARLYSSSILMLQNRPEEAIPLAQEAVGLNTSVALSYSHLGTALFYTEKKNTPYIHLNFGPAREAYYRCLALDPNDLTALTNLAII